MKPATTFPAARRKSAHLTALIALLAALFAVLPNNADAATLVAADGGALAGPYQSWVDEASLPTPGGTIIVREASGPCAATACATYGPPTVWMGSHASRRDLLHEIGHHFDAQAMTDGSRAAFTRMAGLGARPWGAGANAPSERFAVAYAMCAASPSRPDASHWEYGYRPTVLQHRAVCGLIRQVGGR